MLFLVGLFSSLDFIKNSPSLFFYLVKSFTDSYVFCDALARMRRNSFFVLLGYFVCGSTCEHTTALPQQVLMMCLCPLTFLSLSLSSYLLNEKSQKRRKYIFSVWVAAFSLPILFFFLFSSSLFVFSFPFLLPFLSFSFPLTGFASSSLCSPSRGTILSV